MSWYCPNWVLFRAQKVPALSRILLNIKPKASTTVPHTRPGRCVALLGPFSLHETPPKECTNGTLGEIRWWHSHSRPQRSYIRNIRRNKYSATHPPKQVHSLRDIRPNRCTGWVQDETQDHAATHTPQPSIFCNIYEDETNTAPHTCFGGCVAISDNAHREIQERAATQDPNTLDYPQNTQRHLKYGATHPLQQVPPLCNTRPDQCTDQAQGETRQCAATPDPRLLNIHAFYNDKTNTVPHTRFGRVYDNAKRAATAALLLLSLSTKPHLTNGQRRPAVKYGVRSQSDPNPRASRTIIRQQIRYATHPLQRVHSLRENPPDKPMKTQTSPQYIYCMISDPTNAQIRPRAKHRTTQPPIPPDLDFLQHINETPHNEATEVPDEPHTHFGGYSFEPLMKTCNAAEQIHENRNPHPKQNPGTKPMNKMTCPKVNRQAMPQYHTRYGGTHPHQVVLFFDFYGQYHTPACVLLPLPVLNLNLNLNLNLLLTSTTKYHTPTKVVMQKEQCKLLLLIQTRAPKTTTHPNSNLPIQMTHPMVKATPLVPHTCPSRIQAGVPKMTTHPNSNPPIQMTHPMVKATPPVPHTHPSSTTQADSTTPQWVW
ncbi:hypothetical protein BS47DRAFT_1365483 [Hydnum rufescens UP504]|uniref:Uncharacterized protein n=1 Tax=Hydnum rufescens UP504 TaxID=1448309 RepID=A0A9P6ANM3_9AGAM|nr:hypothetical protein BS47DRAFT_1365483 [Hydnum rufescens UP504]